MEVAFGIWGRGQPSEFALSRSAFRAGRISGVKAMNRKRYRSSVSELVGHRRRRPLWQAALVGVAVAVLGTWCCPLAAGAAPHQDLDDPEALSAFMGMPDELAEVPGRVVHAGLTSTPTLLTFRVAAVREGRDLNVELASLTDELAGEGWDLSAAQEYMGAFEFHGTRGDKVLLASIEAQPDGSVTAFYAVEQRQEAPDAAPPGAVLQDIDQLRADASLTFTNVQLIVTSTPLQHTGVPLGPRTIDAGSSLLVSMEAPADRADAVNAAVVALCDQAGFECPDGLGVTEGRVYGTIRIPGGSEGTISSSIIPDAGVVGVSFTGFGEAGVELPDVSLPEASLPDTSLPDVGGAGPDGSEESSTVGRGEAQQSDDEGTDTSADESRGLAVVAPAVGAAVLVLLIVVGSQRRRRAAAEHVPQPDGFALANVVRPVGRADAAVRQLAALAANAGARIEVQAVRVGEGAVEVLLAHPIDVSASPFESPDGRTWTIADGAIDESLTSDGSAFGAAAHALVCAGYLADEPVLIDIATGVTLLQGETSDVDQLMQGWAAELAEGRWSTRPAVLAFDVPINRADVVKVDENSLRSFAARRAGQTTVVFASTNSSVEASSIGDAGVVCRQMVAAMAARTVSIGDGGVRVEPAGLDLDPLRLEPTAAEPSPTAEPATAEPATESEPSGPAVHGAPRVLVRVLGSVTIDGAEKVAMRRSKVKECITYLAFHRDGVTGDQLMSALWPDGSANRGMLNQTLSRARQAMGDGADGTPIIRYVAAARYGASPDLVTDLEMLEEALATGSSTSGLIVGGTPFSSSEGYEWAYREGHVARANVLIERANEVEGTRPG